jgi:hypothetical protein
MRVPRALVVMVIASLLTALGPAIAASAAAAPQSVGTGKWQQAMAQLPLPAKGCFTGAYPKVEWQPARCKTAPKTPFEPAPPLPPGASPPPQLVGGAAGATDYSAVVSGVLSSAMGSFDSESAGVTESGPVPTSTGPGPSAPNTYSLQLNTQTFTTTACSSSAACVGWEQFVYDSASNDVYIQFWLEHYDATCPSGWTTFTFPNNPSDIYCYTNSQTVSLTVATPSAGSLSSVSLTGKAPVGGTDAVVMTVGGTAVGTATNPDSTLNLGKSWNTAEFGVFGDGWGSEASFSAGTDLKVRVTTHSGTRSAPSCVLESFTGETNSLSLAAAPAIGTAASPAMVSDQNASPGTAASCATASGIGDTHLTTFRDLLYDFQAAGDFELATTGPGFVVQARQVSGAPTWPNAAVNQAIAARVGPSVVAVCTAPNRLVINKKVTHLANGGQLRLPGGGAVSLSGNVYLIRAANGDSVHATVNPGSPSWINVSVGLHRWPVAESGLLANAGTNALAIESRGGTVLTAPFPFNEFYGVYGNSWRVPASESLLSPCGGKVVSGNPATVFYAGNLPPGLAKEARTICLQSGVRAASLLDACTVDVAVLRSKAAARAYLGEPANVVLGEITPPAS